MAIKRLRVHILEWGFWFEFKMSLMSWREMLVLEVEGGITQNIGRKRAKGEEKMGLLRSFNSNPPPPHSRSLKLECGVK